MIQVNHVKEKMDSLGYFKEDFPNLSEEDVKRKKKFLSPFSNEKTPSFNFIYGKNGEVRFNCHSTGQYGDGLEYLKKRKSFNLPEVLKYLNEKHNLNLNGSAVKNTISDNRWKATYFSEMTTPAKNYWKNIGVTESILSKMNVRQIDTLVYTTKEGKPSKFFFGNKKVIAFEFVKNGRRKCYIPKQKEFETKGVFQTCIVSDLFGGKSNFTIGDNNFGILCEGEKDTLVMRSLGFTAYCLQSANVELSNENYRKLRKVANDWIVLYDNDDAGRKGARKIATKWGLPIFKFSPDEMKEGEDFADLAKRKRQKGDKTKDKKSGKETWALNWSKLLRSNFKECIEKHKLFWRKNIWEDSNHYYKLVPKNKPKEGEEIEYKRQPISNFIIKSEVFIEGENDAQRIVKLQNSVEETDFFSIPTESFVSKKAFQIFTESKGNFYFFGSDLDLSALKQFTFSTAKKAIHVNQMGYNLRNDNFVLSNAIILNDGRVSKPDKFGIVNGLYIPAADKSNRFNPDFGIDRKYIYQLNNNLKIWDWFGGLSELYNPTAACIGIAHVIATLNYDVITEKHLKLPLLNIWGQKGSGKNSFVELLLCLFGKDENLTHLGNSTPNKISRVMSQTANIPQWFDEFKAGMRNYLAIIEVLKGFYDRTGRGRAITTNDTKTKQDRILTSAIITGQDSIKDEALLSRLVTLQFPVIKSNKEKSRRFFKYQNDFRLGLGHVLSKILSYRIIVEQNLTNRINDLKSTIGHEMIERGHMVTARLIDNYAVLLAPMIICIENGLKLIGETGNPENIVQDILILVYDNIEKQALNEEEKDEVSAFWETFFSMIERQKIIAGMDYLIKNNKVSISAFVLQEYEKFSADYKRNELWLSKSDVISYMKQKDYYLTYKKVSLVTRTSGTGKKQKQSHICDITKMPKFVQEKFEEISNYKINKI